ncbi:13653_t:CDS:1 [Ambispora gerdemannii]|uniref:13653_t:CDS:1 n=1 Tax=Ambispora gerdemannii TaxID=144530 RepID=A0A9N9BXE7_9GLOM|nr:13653_t:CDS:1 [Ambispora gerdemannii]
MIFVKKRNQTITRHRSYGTYHHYPSKSISVSSCLPPHFMWLPENPKSLTVDTSFRSGLSFMSENSNFPYFGSVPSTLCANSIIQSPATTSDPSVDFSPSQTENFLNSIIQSPVTTSDPSVDRGPLQTEDFPNSTWDCDVNNNQHSKTYSSFPLFRSVYSTEPNPSHVNGSEPITPSSVTTSDPSVDSSPSQTENFLNSFIQSPPITTSDQSIYSDNFDNHDLALDFIGNKSHANES